MPRNYLMKYRGFPSLTLETLAKLTAVLSVGASVETACKYAGIAKSTFYRWRQAGKALHLGEECQTLPRCLPRQPGETDTAYKQRRAKLEVTCELLENLYLTCMQIASRKRVRKSNLMK